MNATMHIHSVLDLSFADSFCMQEQVPVYDKSTNNETGQVMMYREYLQRFDPDNLVLSVDRNKYEALQTHIADHFVILDGMQHDRHGDVMASLTKKQLYIQQEHRYLGGSISDVAKYNVEALKMLQSLLLYGFYNEKDKMIEAAKICFVAIQYHLHILHPTKPDDVNCMEEMDDYGDSTSSSDIELLGDSRIGYSSLVQNEIPHRDESKDWHHFLHLEDESFDNRPSQSEMDMNFYKDKADTDRSSLSRDEHRKDGLGDLMPPDRPSYRSGTGSMDTTTDINRRGLYITRLCLRHDQLQEAIVCREHVRQNQRWSGINWLPESFLNPVGAYSSPNKSLASRFSFHHSIEDAKSDPGGLPNTYAWVWTEDWTIQHVQYLTPDQPTRSHDNGWFYAVNWPHTFYPEKQSRLHFVRKREWERDRRQKTAIEFIDDLMDSGFSKEAVYGALSKPDNMTSSGKMNFEKIYKTLADHDSEAQAFDIDVTGEQTETITQSSTAIPAGNLYTQSIETQPHYLASKVLSKSCEVLLNITQLILESRVSFFYRVIGSLPAPPIIVSKGDRHAEASHIWKCVRAAPKAGDVMSYTQLTTKGETWFRNIFSDFKLMDKTVFGDKCKDSMLTFNKQMFGLLMEKNHEVCDNALTYLRSYYRQVNKFVSALKQTVVITDPDMAKRYSALRAIVVCLGEDSKQWVHAFPAPAAGLVKSLHNNLLKLQDSLCRSPFKTSHSEISEGDEEKESHFRSNPVETTPLPEMQNLVRVVDGHLLMVRLFKYCVRTSTKTSCGSSCHIFEAVAQVIDTFCENNSRNQKELLPFVSPFIKAFDGSAGNRACNCDNNSFLQVVVSVYSHLNYDHLPLPMDDLVHLLVSFIDISSSKASVLMKVIRILKDLILSCTSATKNVNTGAPLKHIQDAIVNEFFLRENKSKLIFFELNSSRLDSLVKLNRAALIVNYSSSFSLDVTFEPGMKLSNLLAADVVLLYHASLVELFSMCFEDCSDLNYLRCLSFETVMSVLQTMEAYNCPPLVLAYGLYLHRIFLRGNGSLDYLTKIDTGDKTSLDISRDERLYDVLSKLCGVAMAPESLQNNHRRLIFDVTIPCLQSFLVQSFALATQSDHVARERDSQHESLCKLTSQLLTHLLSSPGALSHGELTQVSVAWHALNIPLTSEIRALYDSAATSSVNQDHAQLPSHSGNVGGNDADESGVELRETKDVFMPAEMRQEHVLSLLDHCPVLDQLKTEELDAFVANIIKCFIPGKGQGSSDRFHLFVRRMVLYCREVISCISSEQNKAFLSGFDKRVPHPDLILQESIENVQLILQLLTRLLLKEKINGVIVKQVINQNATGQLIIDIICLGGALRDTSGSGVGVISQGEKLLLGEALHCGIELLHGGNNAFSQRIIYQYLMQPPHAKLFFSAIKRFFDIEVYLQIDDNDRLAEHRTKFVEDMRQLVHVLHFLQLLCEGHYFGMQMLIFSQPTFLQDCMSLFQSLVTCSLRDEFTIVNVQVIFRMLDFFIEIVQGPCRNVQETILKSESFILAMDELACHNLSPVGVDWDDVPSQCLIFDMEQSARTSVHYVELLKNSRLLNFAELKGLKNRILLLQISLLEGRQLAPNDSARFMLKTLKERDSRRRMEMIHNEFKNASKSFATAKNINKALAVTASQDGEEMIVSFIQEEGFLLLTLFDQLSAMDPFLVNRNILPESVHTTVTPDHSNRKPKISTTKSHHNTRLDRYINAQKYKATYSLFRERLRVIEVVWVGKGLFQASFVRPRKCEYLTREMKRRIKGKIDLASDSRVNAFLGELRVASGAMKLQLSLRESSTSFLLWFQNEISLSLVLLAFLINFILMMSIEKGYFSGADRPQFSSFRFERNARVLVYLQCIMETYCTLQALILWVPLVLREWQHSVDQMQQLQHSQAKLTRHQKVMIALSHFAPTIQFALSAVVVNLIVQLDYLILLSIVGSLLFFFRGLYFFLHEPFTMKSPWAGAYIITIETITCDHISSRFLFTVLSFFCLNISQPYWCSMMLLQLVENSQTLRNVIHAITLPAYALLQSCLLGLICIFIFTVFGFYFFPDSFYNENQSVDECSNLLYCYATFLHNGLLNGGGIADHIKGDLGHEPIFSDNSQFTSRIVYDVAFFVFISVLLLNIIFGIIIDTFGNLREMQAEELRLKTSFCFICGLPKEVFDTRASNAVVRGGSSDGGTGGSQRDEVNFNGHVKREHHMWDYMFYLVYIKDKPSCEYTGLESYIARLVEKDDFSWVPVGVSRGVTDESDSTNEAVESLEDPRKVVAEAVKGMSTTLEATMANIMKSETKELCSLVQRLSAELSQLKADMQNSSAPTATSSRS